MALAGAERLGTNLVAPNGHIGSSTASHGARTRRSLLAAPSTQNPLPQPQSAES